MALHNTRRANSYERANPNNSFTRRTNATNRYALEQKRAASGTRSNGTAAVRSSNPGGTRTLSGGTRAASLDNNIRSVNTVRSEGIRPTRTLNNGDAIYNNNTRSQSVNASPRSQNTNTPVRSNDVNIQAPSPRQSDVIRNDRSTRSIDAPSVRNNSNTVRSNPSPAVRSSVPATRSIEPSVRNSAPMRSSAPAMRSASPAPQRQSAPAPAQSRGGGNGGGRRG